MLDIRNLTKEYGKYKAADDVSFAVGSGEIGILLGPNGAGKSTVIKSIAGLLRYKGKIFINGKESRSTEAKKVFWNGLSCRISRISWAMNFPRG